MPLRPALFLARDGVITRKHQCLRGIEAVHWIEGAIETVRSFNNRGWYVFVVTNLNEVSSGLITEPEVRDLHSQISDKLITYEARIDRFYYCPYDESGTVARYRKPSFDRLPKPGMLLLAMADFPVDRDKSAMICSDSIEMEAAKEAGVQGFLFRGGNLHQFSEWAYVDMNGATR